MKSLSVNQIEKARVTVLENARELVEEAELLLANNRFARAYSLAHLACEELAKIPMLVRAGAYTSRGLDVDRTKLDKRIRSHTSKLRLILLMDFLHDSEVEDDADIRRLKEDLQRIPHYNDLKNRSLYASLVDDAFRKPSDLIPGPIATIFLKLTRRRLAFFESVEQDTRGHLEEVANSSEFEAWLESIHHPV